MCQGFRSSCCFHNLLRFLLLSSIFLCSPPGSCNSILYCHCASPSYRLIVWLLCNLCGVICENWQIPGLLPLLLNIIFILFDNCLASQPVRWMAWLWVCNAFPPSLIEAHSFQVLCVCVCAIYPFLPMESALLLVGHINLVLLPVLSRKLWFEMQNDFCFVNERIALFRAVLWACSGIALWPHVCTVCLLRLWALWAACRGLPWGACCPPFL